MKDSKPNLTEKQMLVISKVLQCRSITEGVKEACISKTTFYEWLKDENFRREFERQRKEVVNEAFLELRLSATEAVRVLSELLKANKETI